MPYAALKICCSQSTRSCRLLFTKILFFHMSYFYAPDKLKAICQVGKYTYIDVMKELAKQSNNNKIEIQVGDQIYKLKNTYC